MKSDLAIVRSVEEQKSLMEYLKKTFPEQTHYWIGARKYKDGDAPWKWTTGETIAKEDAFNWVDSAEARRSKIGCLVLHPIVTASYSEPGQNGFCPHACVKRRM